MKKKYAFLLLLCSTVFFGFAQTNSLNGFLAPEVKAKLSTSPTEVDPDFLKKNKFNSKAFGDTLFYEDFNGGLPTGWSITNNNANAAQWEWNTTYRSGMFSVPGDIITSTTAANGFMALPADFHNTPLPVNFLTMDTYFESGNIDLTNNGLNPGGFGSIWVSYQQALRYCCSGANRLVLQVSTDNFVTIDSSYDATNAIAVNAASGTFSNVINISASAANQTSMQIRFLSQGNSHYYWMIDDFAVVEGPDFDMRLENAFPEFNDTLVAINPFYSQIPLDLFPPLAFSGTVINNGGMDVTNARLEVTVSNDSTRATPTSPLTAGLGVQYYNTQTTVANPFSPLSVEPIVVAATSTRFVPTVLGEFTINFLSNSNQVDQNLGNETDVFNFAITDSVLAKDDGGLAGAIATSSFVDNNGIAGGTAVGDRFITMFVIQPSANASSSNPVPTSVSFLVSNDSSNIGVEILPKIWEFDENAATINAAVGNEVASAFIPYIVQASDLGNWITLGLDNGTAVTTGMMEGQYMVGWETTSIAGGTDFTVQNDQSSGSRQPGATSLIYFGHNPAAGWGNIAPTNPGIRLNMGMIPLVTSIHKVEERETILSIRPNPSNGEFNLGINADSKVSYLLSLRNVLGQPVYTELMNVNDQMTKRVDFSTFEKGVYFLSLENETEKITQKIIIQ